MIGLIDELKVGLIDVFTDGSTDDLIVGLIDVFTDGPTDDLIVGLIDVFTDGPTDDLIVGLIEVFADGPTDDLKVGLIDGFNVNIATAGLWVEGFVVNGLLACCLLGLAEGFNCRFDGAAVRGCIDFATTVRDDGQIEGRELANRE